MLLLVTVSDSSGRMLPENPVQPPQHHEYQARCKPKQHEVYKEIIHFVIVRIPQRSQNAG